MFEKYFLDMAHVPLCNKNIQMKKYILTTFSLPIEGMQIEYNKWYDEVHLHDVLNVPEIKTAQRFKPFQQSNVVKGPYLAIYEIETDEIERVIDAFQSGTYPMRTSDAIAIETVSIQFYEVTGDKLSS